MYFITQVTRWDSTKDCDYRIAPLDKGYRDILLNTNRVHKIEVADVNKCNFLYFDNINNINSSPGYIECNDSADTVWGYRDRTYLTRLIQLPVNKKNDPAKATTNILFKVDGLAYADRYNPSPTTHSWVIYYDMGFQSRRILTPYTLEEIAVITSDEGDQQYLLYGEEFVLWRKGARDGKFMLDKVISGTGFAGTEDTDWENVRSIE